MRFFAIAQNDTFSVTLRRKPKGLLWRFFGRLRSLRRCPDQREGFTKSPEKRALSAISGEVIENSELTGNSV